MLQSLSRLSAVRGVIDRRILANYRLDADAAAAVLPAPFRPKLVDGYAIGGLCLIRLKKIRPAAFPIRAGIPSENAAHRIAVEWEAKGVSHEGVYIPRRDTDSRLNTLAGGRLFPGEHHHAAFSVEETHETFNISFTADDGGCSMHIHARIADTFPSGSVFADIEHASRFFQAGSLGYSKTSTPGRFDGLVLNCDSWSVQSLEAEVVRSSFFNDPKRFPEGTAEFDCALLMRGIDHAWHQRGALCCLQDSSGSPRDG